MNFPECNLLLTINSESPNSVEITLENTNFAASKLKSLRYIAYVVCLYFVYFTFLNGKHFLIHASFLVILGLLLTQLLNIVDKETLKVVRDFGIEKATVLSFGRSSTVFVPRNNVHQLVLNEVIYFVSVNYLFDCR